jgi:hypothetical protein
MELINDIIMLDAIKILRDALKEINEQVLGGYDPSESNDVALEALQKTRIFEYDSRWIEYHNEQEKRGCY